MGAIRKIGDITIDWEDKAVMQVIQNAMELTCKEGAEVVAEYAKQNLERSAPDSTGRLASEIEVEPFKFKNGVGWGVVAQAPGKYGKYYASFVDTGTRFMSGNRYLRKALRRGQYWMRGHLTNLLRDKR